MATSTDITPSAPNTNGIDSTEGMECRLCLGKSQLKRGNRGVSRLATAMVSFIKSNARGVMGLVFACAGIVLLSGNFWSAAIAQPVHADLSPSAALDEPVQPIERPHNLDARKIELGRQLFDDVRLSHNDQLSCASCHHLEAGGMDSRRRSIGIGGTVGGINAPTVLNSGFNFRQFWDGRAATLEDQIDGPVQAPSEMGSTWEEVVGKLKGSADYVKAFRQIYSDDIRHENIKDAIAVFERSLATPNSRFDRYLRHDASALSSREQKGYRLFKKLGCAGCHYGVNVGGTRFEEMGEMGPYFTDRGHITKADLGRFNVTGKEQDRHVFKVPTLRNVALTGPYFHDGEPATLHEAVRLMAKYQLGRKLSAGDVDLIVEFLKTLTGELDGKAL